VSNNVVNVPLGAILDEFNAPLGSGVFVVVGFLLAMAATMPLAGWSATGSADDAPTAGAARQPRGVRSVRRPHRRCRC